MKTKALRSKPQSYIHLNMSVKFEKIGAVMTTAGQLI